MNTVLDEGPLKNILAAITPSANANMSYASSPVTSDAWSSEPVVDTSVAVPKQEIKPDPIEVKKPNVNVQSLKTGTSKAGSGGDQKSQTQESPKLMASQVKDFAAATVDTIRAASYIGNAFIAESNAKMKAMSHEYQAQQNERMARLLLMNQRDVTRAAQADANVYKMQQRDVKSAQKVAMAESGFAVGKGTYKNKLDETDARVNYNVSAMMLKASLQNAEITRQAGTYEAQAIINRADAKIARRTGRIEKMVGIMNGVASLASAGASFYSGMNPSEAAISKTTNTTKGNK